MPSLARTSSLLTRYALTPVVLLLGAQFFTPWLAQLLLWPVIVSLGNGSVVGAEELMQDGQIVLVVVVTFLLSRFLFRLERQAPRLRDHFRSCVLLYLLAAVTVGEDVSNLVTQSWIECWVCPPAWYAIVPPAVIGNLFALHLSSRAQVAA